MLRGDFFAYHGDYDAYAAFIQILQLDVPRDCRTVILSESNASTLRTSPQSQAFHPVALLFGVAQHPSTPKAFGAQDDRAFWRVNLQRFHLLAITTSSPFVPGTGIANNLNYPAYRNLRRSGGALVDARPYAEILVGGYRFRKDAWQRSQRADSIIAPAASRILSKAVHWVRHEL